MHPATRTPIDDDFDEVSLATGKETTGRDLTRQEFAREVDVNQILGRFGLPGSPTRRLIYGETDYATDLQDALHAIRDAKEAHASLPPELRREYPTWKELLNALEAGELALAKDEEGNLIEKPKAGAPVAPNAPPGAPPGAPPQQQ